MVTAMGSATRALYGGSSALATASALTIPHPLLVPVTADGAEQRAWRSSTLTAADSYELVWRRQRQRGFVVELREFARRRQCRVVFFFWFKVCGARISMSPFHADDARL